MNKVTHLAVTAVLLALPGACSSPRDNGQESAQQEHTSSAVAQDAAPLVTVYKNPTCECCAEWAVYLRQNGFRVNIKDRENVTEIKIKHGVPTQLSSCHSALVGGYVLEGHVPADVIQQLLRERPKVIGLAVPGMPAGVPGMPPAGPDREPYHVIAFNKQGEHHVYAAR